MLSAVRWRLSSMLTRNALRVFQSSRLSYSSNARMVSARLRVAGVKVL